MRDAASLGAQSGGDDATNEQLAVGNGGSDLPRGRDRRLGRDPLPRDRRDRGNRRRDRRCEALAAKARTATRHRSIAPAAKFSGSYTHRTIEGGIGHYLPREATHTLAQAVLDVTQAHPPRRFRWTIRPSSSATTARQ